jgi:DNA-directed RNA polymerase sigma subunit (sigma70/sigma32)
MILLKHLLLEINWNDYNIAMRGEDFDPLKSGEFELIKQQILDPKTSDVDKEKLKTKVVNSYMRLLPTWYTETGARGNGVPVDDFISLSYEAMLRAMKKFNWEAENQFGAYARMAIRRAVIDYGKAQSKKKQMNLSLDKPMGSDEDEGSKTLADVIPDVSNQQQILDLLDYEKYLTAIKEYFKTIKNPARKYALLKIVQPELRKVPFRELADMIEQQTGDKYTPQGLQAQYTVLVNEVLPKLARKMGLI